MEVPRPIPKVFVQSRLKKVLAFTSGWTVPVDLFLSLPFPPSLLFPSFPIQHEGGACGAPFFPSSITSGALRAPSFLSLPSLSPFPSLFFPIIPYLARLRRAGPQHNCGSWRLRRQFCQDFPRISLVPQDFPGSNWNRSARIIETRDKGVKLRYLMAILKEGGTFVARCGTLVAR